MCGQRGDCGLLWQRKMCYHYGLRLRNYFSWHGNAWLLCFKRGGTGWCNKLLYCHVRVVLLLGAAYILLPLQDDVHVATDEL